MESETEINFQNGDLQRCFKSLETMRRNGQFCDVIFQTGVRSISAHRVVITASIPYFQESLFNAEDISLMTIDSSVFESFIDYAYTQEIKINTENARELLSAACHFRVEEVKEACCDFLSDRIQPENVMDLRELASHLQCWNLLENTNRHIRENFVAVSQTTGFMSAPFLFVRELIGRDDLLVSNEEKVFEAVIKWTKASPEDRKDELPELLRGVRMPLMNLDYLTDKVGREELIRTSIPCRDLLDEAKNCHVFAARKPNAPSFSSKRRSLINQIDSGQNDHETSIYNLIILDTYIVECLQDDGKKWKTIHKATTETNGCAFATMNKEMYFFNRDVSLHYSAEQNVIRFIKTLSPPRTFAGAVSLKSKLIICGGSIGDTALNIVESLDPQKKEWTSLNPMRRRRAGPSVVALGDHIYALGGTDYSSVHDSVERYDSETGRWSIVSRMLTKRCIASAATVKGKIYVCGGDLSPTAGVLKCLATAEVYDPNENTWRFISPMKTSRCEVILLPFRGKLYALGGFDDRRRCLSAVEIYDPESDKWEYGPTPSNTEFFLSCAVAM